MKKILSVLLSCILILTLLPVSFASQPGKYMVTKDIAVVYSAPALTSEKLAEVTKNTILDITEVRSNGFGRVTLKDADITGWIQMTALKAMSDASAETDIIGIEIKSLPGKLTYTDGLEELDLSGLSVYAHKKNGSSIPVSGYNVYAPEMKVPGEKTVIITYSPDGTNVFSAEFNVTVIRVPVTKISVTSLPETQYLEHKTLDLSALQVSTEFSVASMNETLTYEEIAANPDYAIIGCHGETHGCVLEKGTHTITVIYKYSDISCSFDIEVTPRTLIQLNILQQPEKLTVYSNSRIPATDGLILEAVYDNGETEEIPHYDCQTVCDPSEFIVGPGNEVRVYYGELYVTLYFRYLENPQEQGIRLRTPIVLTFYKGELIDLSDIKVYLYYTDGTYIEINDYDITPVNYTMMGSQNIAVTYKGYSEVFTIFITPYYSKGDINGDGIISAEDARLALRASVDLITLSGMTLFAGDADRDGIISAEDARRILRAAVDLENIYVSIK